MSDTPTTSTRTASEAAIGQGGDYVLYWIIAARRPWRNFDLHRAVERTGELAKPVGPGYLPQAGTATAAGGTGRWAEKMPIAGTSPTVSSDSGL